MGDARARRSADEKQRSPPLSKRARATLNSVDHAIREALRSVSRLEADGLAMPMETKRTRDALGALRDRVGERLHRSEERARQETHRAQLERQVSSALATLKRLSAMTVEDVLVDMLGRDRASITPAELALVGQALTRAGWVQTRPRGPGGTRKRVYLGPPMRLFAEAEVGQ